MKGWTDQTTRPVVGFGERRSRLAGVVVCVILLAPLAAQPLTAGVESAYTFGVFPFLAPAKVEQIFNPIAVRISEHLGHEVHVRSSNTFEDFQKALGEERFDLAFVQPFDYVRFAAKHGYRPLVARSDPLAGLLVLPEDSPIGTVEDLRGKVVALPPSSAAVSYLILSLLRDHGLVPGETVTIRHTRNHETCLANMLVRDVAACGTALGPLSVFASRVPARTRILATSAPIPGPLVVAHDRLGKQAMERARRELLDYAPPLLSRERHPEGEDPPFVAIGDADYEPVRRIAARLGVL